MASEASRGRGETTLLEPLRGLYLVVGEESDPLHLVEDGVVAGVDLVPPVDVSGQ